MKHGRNMANAGNVAILLPKSVFYGRLTFISTTWMPLSARLRLRWLFPSYVTLCGVKRHFISEEQRQQCAPDFPNLSNAP